MFAYFLQKHRFTPNKKIGLVSALNRKSSSTIYVSAREEIATGGTAFIHRVVYCNGTCEIEKKLIPKFQLDPEYEALQDREFEILSSLEHPLIVKASRIERQISQAGHGSTRVLVLEHVEGKPLRELQTFLQTLTSEIRQRWSMDLLFQLVSIVRYLAFRSVVHGDVTPENILVQPCGFIKLIDFGVARSENGAPLPFKVGGRLQFRAPELLEEGSTSHLGDIYSVAKVFEWCLGETLANLEINKKIIERMMQRRILPKVSSRSFDFSRGLFPLPERHELYQAPILREPTKLILEPSASSFRLQRFQAALLVLLIPFLTTWNPLKSVLTINTLPYSLVDVAVHNQHFQGETPIRNLEVPIGRAEILFIIPTQKNRRILRRLSLKPEESVKVFEDFSKY